MKVLVTGCAGFIGSHVCELLISQGAEVVGIDNFDPMYPKRFKEANLRELNVSESFRMYEVDLRFLPNLKRLAQSESGFDAIVHLAARAGVRPSIKDPVGYIESNVIATQLLTQFAEEQRIKNFVFASSSSIYGNYPIMPWTEEDAGKGIPISPYAGTKIAAEKVVEIHSHLTKSQATSLRFFTVYGPRQRPDLAISKFVRATAQGQPIERYGKGRSARDYTYVSDIAEGVVASILRLKGNNYEAINLGFGMPLNLRDMIDLVGEVVEREPEVTELPEQKGDVTYTWASILKASDLLGYSPKVHPREGIQKFYDWWKES